MHDQNNQNNEELSDGTGITNGLGVSVGLGTGVGIGIELICSGF
ncbi:hypothetical protein [Candidatus Endomicrobiellum agilis]